MRGIYPDYTGPTAEYRHATRFPNWVHLIGGVLPVPPEAFYGGVIVLTQTYAAVRLSITAGVAVTTGLLRVEVLSNTYVVAMVPRAISAIISGVRAAVDQLGSRLGYKGAAKEGAVVINEESGIE
jgi:hypothetical protein